MYQFPKLGVSAAIWRDGKVLLAQRGKEPLKGVWSLPGGSVEHGEEIRKAALRELKEETGVDAELFGVVDVADVIRRDATAPSPFTMRSSVSPGDGSQAKRKPAMTPWLSHGLNPMKSAGFLSPIAPQTSSGRHTNC